MTFSTHEHGLNSVALSHYFLRVTCICRVIYNNRQVYIPLFREYITMETQTKEQENEIKWLQNKPLSFFLSNKIDIPYSEMVKTECGYQGCKEILYFTNKYNCKYCKKVFCENHKLPENHNCDNPKLPGYMKRTSQKLYNETIGSPNNKFEGVKQ